MKYAREGTYSILLLLNLRMCSPLYTVQEHRKAIDGAKRIKFLVDEMYPNIEKFILVMAHLNIHKLTSLYKKYLSEEARRIIKKREFIIHSNTAVDLISPNRTQCYDLIMFIATI